ncbi:P-loop containing nucleoside triphosphate hydrolase protein [Mycena maculata]|uniref:ATP-dependent DNA helicase n=1 Tax=Mycena maculata TaxID=230809 RepID=A0AAD7HYE2_9AGAR|nr:P-loop containing nucleoside triphosphate hydrolase protein [Mycena maculata]
MAGFCMTEVLSPRTADTNPSRNQLTSTSTQFDGPDQHPGAGSNLSASSESTGLPGIFNLDPIYRSLDEAKHANNPSKELVALRSIEIVIQRRIYDIENALSTTPSSTHPELGGGQFASDEKDDEAAATALPETCADTPTAEEVAQSQDVLERVFGIQSFRKDQLAVIIAVRRRKDVLVLMPTGGGKSLCYQLSAVSEHERTNGCGLTVVVCPLISLIDDQVEALITKKINTLSLTSETLNTSPIKEQLRYSRPAVRKRGQLYEALREMYSSGCLSLFAIDEAHCISTCGHDFRDAYLELGTLRDEFPDVPIMALTATASPETITDIVRRLKLRQPLQIKQSFNRQNLEYSVKTKHNQDELIGFIKEGHLNQPGIVYCLGKKKCERIAKKLSQKGIKAIHYHGCLSRADKKSTLKKWKGGIYDVVVATTAFGMGIDKADATSRKLGELGVTGYPRIYDFRDLKFIRDLTPSKKETGPQHSIQRENAALAVARYCEEKVRCRRLMLLQHFGEEGFNKRECRENCDNCAQAGLIGMRDLTNEAKDAVTLVKQLSASLHRLTVLQCIQVFCGANTMDTRKIEHNRSSLFGSGKSLSKKTAELLFRQLLYHGILFEEAVQNSSYKHYYVTKGPNADEFLTGNGTFYIAQPHARQVDPRWIAPVRGRGERERGGRGSCVGVWGARPLRPTGLCGAAGRRGKVRVGGKRIAATAEPAHQGHERSGRGDQKQP